MIVGESGSVYRLLLWQWRAVALFAVVGTVVTALHEFEILRFRFPPLPLGVVGGALGIFVSFRTNNAYARWWEGRQLWGRLINSSRHFALQVLSYMRPADSVDVPSVQREIVIRHIAYVHALRAHLRKENVLADENVVRVVPESDRQSLAREKNIPYAILHKQFAQIEELSTRGAIDQYRLQGFDRLINDFLDVQGGCERIKNTPMPRSYGFIAERLIWVYACLFPFAIVEDMSWLTVPANVLVCIAFTLIGEVGRVLEDPFNMFFNTVPMSALSTTIEINLRQTLGDTELPDDPKPVPPGVLY
jgi:ion channel-forming bestrophin family protein